MKNVILSLVAALSLNAAAMSPVPAPVNGLLQMNVGGGMPIAGGLRFRTIVITHAGEVTVNEAYFGKDFNDMFKGGLEREYLLGNVEPADLAALEQEAAKITRGGLVKKDNGPGCMDAPGYSYGVVKGTAIVTVYSRFNCQDSLLRDKSARPAARMIKQYLDQWNAIN